MIGGTTKEVVEKNGGDTKHIAFQLTTNLIPELTELIEIFCEGNVFKASKFIDFKTLRELNKSLAYYLRRDQVLELSLSIKNKRDAEDMVE